MPYHDELPTATIGDGHGPDQFPTKKTTDVPRLVVADVIVQGSTRFTTPEVMTYLKTRRGDFYDVDIVQEDVRNLIATKRFAEARAQVEELPNGRVKVYYLLRDLRNTIQSIRYSGAKHLKDEELTALTGLHIGDPCNPARHLLACEKILREYNEKGRPFAECRLVKGDKPGETEVIFVITEGPAFKISDIRFTGNKFVSSEVLATHIRSSKQILIFTGEYNKELLDDDLCQLIEYYRLFGYHDVAISMEVQHQPDGNTAVIVFHIIEGVRYRLKDIPTVAGRTKVPRQDELAAVLKMKPGEFYDGTKLKHGADEIHDWYGSQGFDVHVAVNNVFSKDEQGVVRVQYDVTLLGRDQR